MGGDGVSEDEFVVWLDGVSFVEVVGMDEVVVWAGDGSAVDGVLVGEEVVGSGEVKGWVEKVLVGVDVGVVGWWDIEVEGGVVAAGDEGVEGVGCEWSGFEGCVGVRDGLLLLGAWLFRKELYVWTVGLEVVV